MVQETWEAMNIKEKEGYYLDVIRRLAADVKEKASGEFVAQSEYYLSNDRDPFFSNEIKRITELSTNIAEVVGNDLEILTGTELIEIDNIKYQMREYGHMSEKIKKAKTLTYSLELSDKDPLDVTYGNESGSCILISPNDLSNGYGLPHMIADNATYIFNIYQSINTGKKRRVGIVLAFDTVSDSGKRVLACNSLELSAAMNPIPLVPEIVDYVESGLVEFAKANGFDEVKMSAHDYNTSKNHSSRHSSGNVNFIIEKIKKVCRVHEPSFYSEILDESGQLQGEFYSLN